MAVARGRALAGADPQLHARAPAGGGGVAREAIGGRSMEAFGPATFGELYADEYDELHDPGTTEATVEFISQLAGKGAILELAIGTGRIALPLLRAGHRISGIEGSPDMVAKLRAKPDGAKIPVAIGDFAGRCRWRSLRSRLPGLQHAVQPAKSGRSGPVLSQCRPVPGGPRHLPGGDVRSGRVRLCRRATSSDAEARIGPPSGWKRRRTTRCASLLNSNGSGSPKAASGSPRWQCGMRGQPRST